MIGRNCTMMGTAGGVGVTTGDGAGAGADDDDDALLEEDRAPPLPLVSVPTDVTDAESAELRSDPNVIDEVVTVDSRFSSHSAI